MGYQGGHGYRLIAEYSTGSPIGMPTYGFSEVPPHGDTRTAVAEDHHISSENNGSHGYFETVVGGQ